jgi:hypothetical protein
MHFYVNSELQHVRVCCRVLNQRHLLKGWMGDWGAEHGSEERKMESAAIQQQRAVQRLQTMEAEPVDVKNSLG